MKQVKMGIIGCGVMGSRHAATAAASPLIDLVAVADPVSDRARQLAAQHQVPGVYTDGLELLAAPEVDAVVLALPTRLRDPLVLAAFGQGKHALIEKPVAMNAAALEQMIAARGSLVAGVCSCRFRLLPSAVEMTGFLGTDPLGPIRSVFIRDFSSAPPRPDQEKPAWRLSRDLNGGGILVNWGCYDLDYVLGLLGWRLQPSDVSAQSWTIPPMIASHVPAHSDAETHLAAFIRCTGGEVILYERGEYVPLQTTCKAWEIIGDHGALRLELKPGTGKRIYHDYLDAEQGAISQVIWEGDEEMALIHGWPTQDFAEALLAGRPPATPLEQARVLQQITDAVYHSAAIGSTVTINQSETPR